MDQNSKEDNNLFEEKSLKSTNIVPGIVYKEATKIEDVLKETVKKIKYKAATKIEEVGKSKDSELKVMEEANILAKPKKEEPKKEEPKKEEVKKVKKKPKKKAKIDNAYTEASTYLIILIIIISLASIYLVITTKQKEKKTKVIELYGDETVVLNVNDRYIESGYVAVDFNKGDVTRDVVVSNNVDTSTPGIYEVKYEFKSGSIRTTAKRNVIVTNKNSIDFRLAGNSTVFSKLNAEFVEDGYVATYNGEDYSHKVKRFGEVDLNKPGLYKLYYAIAIDGNVKALYRNVIVYAGDILSDNEPLVEEVNNYLIDEVHYSSEITLDNINSSVLLYFGALNCKDLNRDQLNSCLNELFKTDKIEIKANTTYVGKNAEILFNKKEDKFVIKKLDLPRNLDNLAQVIVEGDNLYVYETYAYEVLINNKEICDGKTKKLLYSGVDRNTETGYETCTKSCPNCEIMRSRHYRESLYLHTFKKVADKYVWIKTEMIK